MQRLPEFRMPEDWRRRTRVFVAAAAKPRRGLAPLVPREVYKAEREPTRQRDQVRRERFLHTRQ